MAQRLIQEYQIADLDASKITSGTFNNARISVSNVTQHQSSINHDLLTGFVGNEHVNHANIDIIAGAGLTGGGNITADRTLNVGAGTGIDVNANDVALDTGSSRNTDHTSITLTAGTGMTGGGNINANRTFNVIGANSIVANANDIQLVNDVASPGNSKLYGTNGAGTKGWYDQPTGGGGGSPSGGGLTFLGGGYELIEERTIPAFATSADFTGLDEYQDILVTFHVEASGGTSVTTLLRESGGTFRQVNTVSVIGDSMFGRVEIFNFNRGIYPYNKLVQVEAAAGNPISKPPVNTIDNSTGYANGSAMSVYQYNHILDEIRFTFPIQTTTNSVFTVYGRKAPGTPTGDFRGALVYLTGFQGPAGGGSVTLNWDAEAYDTDGIHDNAVNNSRLTVPAGVTKVRLTAKTRFTSFTNGADVSIYKNGNISIRLAGNDAGTDGTVANDGRNVTISTPVVPVVPGDYFEVRVDAESGTAATCQFGVDYTNFGMELVEASGAPSSPQGVGFSSGQTWQATGNSFNTIYTNNFAYPIAVHVVDDTNAGPGGLAMNVRNNAADSFKQIGGAEAQGTSPKKWVGGIIQPGAQYQVTNTAGGSTTWYELK